MQFDGLYMYLIYAFLLFCCGHFFGWYATNIQFTSEWWASRPLLSVLVFGTPAGLCFFYGTKFCMLAIPELWSARFIAGVLSYLIFPIMTWYYLSESPFTAKTMICAGLAFCIMMVQLFYK